MSGPIRRSRNTISPQQQLARINTWQTRRQVHFSHIRVMNKFVHIKRTLVVFYDQNYWNQYRGVYKVEERTKSDIIYSTNKFIQMQLIFPAIELYKWPSRTEWIIQGFVLANLINFQDQICFHLWSKWLKFQYQISINWLLCIWGKQYLNWHLHKASLMFKA